MNRRHTLQLGALTGAGIACSPRAFGASSMPNYSSTEASLITTSTPREDGFAMPGEWERHLGTLMVFVPEQNWKHYGLDGARKEWAKVANTIAEFEPVTMVVDPSDRGIASRLLSSEIHPVYLPVNDGWSRDTGPMFVTNSSGERRIAGFVFNGWGNKFPPHDDDALLKARLAAHYQNPMYVSSLVLEGGAVTVDGRGTLITTEECLLHRNRNPQRTKAEVEQQLKEYLGVTKVIWLPKGLTPDPITNGHVDGLAAFARPGVVLLHHTDNRWDPNAKRLQKAKAILEQSRDAEGRLLQVIELPLAEKVAHMNFYLCNGGVIVPTENNPTTDEPALEVLRNTFPKRTVVGIHGSVLAKGGGGIHCITQQIPA
ncbi:MAG: agmatine deiminase family protein [Verrucomicrobiota bacterium]